MARPTPFLIPLVAGLIALVILAWWWPNRPQAGDVAMADARFNSVSFAPVRDGQSPQSDRFPTAEQVEDDIRLIAPYVRNLRTYAANEGKYDVAAIARKYGLTVWQGIWLGSNPDQNTREIEKGIALARRYPDTITRVIVGNEVLLRRDLSPEALIAAIDHVKSAIRQPVTYGDVWDFWRQFPQVADHVDIVTLHLLPYWEDDPTGIDQAVAHVEATYQSMAALFPSKTIAIGETGWPSRGRARRDAVPGVVNQAVFLRRFVDLARRRNYDYNLIEAFDQTWKYADEGVVGASWGLWSADRGRKFPLSGPIVENPRWPRHAVLACVLGLSLLGIGLASAPRLPRRAQLRLTAIAIPVGAALGFAAAQSARDTDDTAAWIAAAGNLAGQSALAVLFIRRITGLKPTRPRAAIDAIGAIRARRLPPAETWFDDLAFVFAWTAMVLQLLLVFDPRYRDFPLPTFAVPLVVVSARIVLRDLPRGGGGRVELAVGLTLTTGAIASVVLETVLNTQALAWNACALLLAAPLLLRTRRA